MINKHIEELSGTGVINIYPPSVPKIKTDFTISNESPQIPSEWLMGEGAATVMEVPSGYYMVIYDLVYETAQKRATALRELAKY